MALKKPVLAAIFIVIAIVLILGGILWISKTDKSKNDRMTFPSGTKQSGMNAGANTQTGPTVVPPNMALCPPVDHLEKNNSKGTWFSNTTAGFWKSYQRSFATKVLKFLGAQWQGENIGQLTCIYSSEQINHVLGDNSTQPTLPVQLVFHSTAFVPSGGRWVHPKRGVRNCLSKNRNDCYFKPILQEKTGNIFKEAASFKQNQPSYVAPPPSAP